MNGFLQQAFSSVWSIALIALFFGGSIFVHELGHFLAARRRGLRIERFSIGFGPKIFSWVRNGVEYRLSWLPLGGYVALPQLADMRGIEGGGADGADDPLPPISYADKMIVSVMGAVFNVLFAFALACVIWVFGFPTTDQQTTTQIGFVAKTITLPDGTEVESPAARAGLQEGDRVIAIDGREVADWGSLRQTLVSTTGRTADGAPRAVLTIERDGRSLQVEILPQIGGDERMRLIGISPAEPILVGDTLPNSPAALGGMKAGDAIVAVDGRRLFSRWQVEDLVQSHLNRDLTFTVDRDGQRVDIVVRPVEVVHTSDGRTTPSIGVGYATPRRLVHPGPVAQIREQFVQMYRVLSALLHPQSDLGIGQMNGPPGIVRVLFVTSQIDIRITIWVTILININLAVFNLLPIPVLDGGHMLFATLAKLRGRALPAKFIAASQSAFMLLLFSLMIFVSFRDVGRWFRDSREDERIERTYITPVFPAPNGG
ncbi:sigma E protease regulator RseP [Opitutales bacterium ASA1]|uniref:RIP metalloprotease RseP n=1 Tax=Congregicoccus parvus TaxID=3081749 RepID=UPI002B319D3D|nr:sigma E protease regulator RseP [Opitutales bacterium ASA1]